jgi:AraC-like DNA-binding protein
MSRALAVFHGLFGRATVYQLNRPFNTHAHREGHLIFQVGGTPARIRVGDDDHVLGEDVVVAVNPWEPHNFAPTDIYDGALFFVLYVNAGWFASQGDRGHRLSFGCTRISRTRSLARNVERAAALVCGEPSLTGLDMELRALIDACHEESWAQAEAAPTRERVTDFRIRRSIQLMAEALSAEIALDDLARRSGLSRPHFYKLFRAQTGLTPHLYLNTLLMEKALDGVAAGDGPMADIASELGFSSQSAFTRFFAGNVGMAPREYRRAVKVLRA